jgi:hypothetical protein
MPIEPASPDERFDALLARPDAQRRREFKYRFSQSVVFGLPVVALQLYGAELGPADSERWVSLLQALLAGWVVYVNLGMLAEGMILLAAGRIGRAPLPDLVVSSLAATLYLYSLVSAVVGITAGRLWYRPLLFHVCVTALAAWSAWRWWRLSRGAGG